LLPSRSNHAAGGDERACHRHTDKNYLHSTRLDGRLMPNVFGGYSVNRVLGDVGGVVTYPLEATRDKDQIEIAAELFGILRHSFN
jgi:hypothetical protein